MSTPAGEIAIQISTQAQLRLATLLDRPIEIGRQRLGEQAPVARIAGSVCDRIVIASTPQTQFSRSHLYLQPTPAGILITNSSRNRIVELQDSGALLPGKQCTVQSAVVSMEHVRVEIGVTPWGIGDYDILESSGQFAKGRSQAEPFTEPLINSLDGEFGTEQQQVLLQWLRQIAEIYQLPASSPEFLYTAAEKLVQIIGFDQIQIARCDLHRWESILVYPPQERCDPSWMFCDATVQMIRKRRTVVWHKSGESDSYALIVSPLLGPDDQVIGAIYGQRSNQTLVTISRFEAVLTEFVANAISSGWRRTAQEG